MLLPLLRLIALAAAAVTVSACRGTGVSRPHPFSTGIPLSASESLNVAVWNIQKATAARLHPDLVELVRAHQIDLAITQESRDDIPAAGELGSIFAPAWHLPWPGGTAFGVHTYAATPPISAHRLPTVREFVVTLPKVSLATKHAVAGGKPLLVINTHALNFEAGWPIGLRWQFAAIGRSIAAHDGPVIFAGDFNTWSPRRLRLLSAVTDAHGLREITTFSGGPRKTGALRAAWLHRLAGIDPGLPLDRVFLRGLQVDDATVLHSDASDHAPLVLQLRFDPAPPTALK